MELQIRSYCLLHLVTRNSSTLCILSALFFVAISSM